MHGNISFMFDCWADPVVHLLLLKSPMAQHSHEYTLNTHIRICGIKIALFGSSSEYHILTYLCLLQLFQPDLSKVGLHSHYLTEKMVSFCCNGHQILYYLYLMALIGQHFSHIQLPRAIRQIEITKASKHVAIFSFMQSM